VVTFTALAIIVTGAWMQEGLKGAPMTAWALEQGMGGGWGLYTVAISVMVYAFTTILGWSYYGERCMERLVGRVAVMPYRLVFSGMVFVGAVTSLEVVWTFSDIANGLMALPNLIGLLLLSGIVVKETRDYMSRKNWKSED